MSQILRPGLYFPPSLYYSNKKRSDALNQIGNHTRFILSIAFIAFAAYNYKQHDGHITFKAVACALVGVAYSIYGYYCYRRKKKSLE